MSIQQTLETFLTVKEKLYKCLQCKNMVKYPKGMVLTEKEWVYWCSDECYKKLMEN